MLLQRGSVSLSCQKVLVSPVESVVSSLSEVMLALVDKCPVLKSQSAFEGYMILEVDEIAEEGSVEEELVVSDPAWEILLLVDLVVVKPKTKVLRHIPI